MSSGRRFPDQAAPYAALGCDLRSLYHGTLFRFPLRTAELAAASQISRQAYSPQEVAGWLATLRQEAMRVLLFLKHVVRLQVRAACTASRAAIRPQPLI